MAFHGGHVPPPFKEAHVKYEQSFVLEHHDELEQKENVTQSPFLAEFGQLFQCLILLCSVIVVVNREQGSEDANHVMQRHISDSNVGHVKSGIGMLLLLFESSPKSEHGVLIVLCVDHVLSGRIG